MLFRFKKLNLSCITRIELVLCIPIWIIQYFLYKSGIHLLSRAVSSKVPSAACVLTIVFGMGTGVSHRRIDTRNCEHLISLLCKRISCKCCHH